MLQMFLILYDKLAGASIVDAEDDLDRRTAHRSA